MSNPLQNVLNAVALMVPTCPRLDPSEGFSDYDRVAYEATSEVDFDVDQYGDEGDDHEDECGSWPSEYDEWQDYMGGDDNPWDAGDYDGDY